MPNKKSPENKELVLPPEPPKSLLKLAKELQKFKNSNNIQKYNDLKENILKIIHDKDFIKTELSSSNESPLIFFIKKLEEDIVIKLISSDDSNPGQVDSDKNTALILACSNNLEKIALKIIATGKSNPGIMDSNNETALMIACRNNLSKVAYKIFSTGESNIQAKNNDNETALIIACMHNYEKLALGLIQTGESSPEVVDNLKNTALIYACQNKMIDSALQLIGTDDSNPGVINMDNETAIIIACQNAMSDVVLELIYNPEINIQDENYAGETLLIIACNNEMVDVALKLIETDNINLEKKDSSGQTALDIAISNNLQDVVDELKIKMKLKIDKIHIFDVNAKGNNMMDSTNDVIVKDHLIESYDNICFMVNDNYYFTNKKIIKKQLKSKINIKYGCIVAGDTEYDATGNLKGKNYADPANIDYSQEYFNMSSIIPLQILVNLDDMKQLVTNKFSSNMIVLVSSKKILPGIIAPDYEGELGADHCQTGKSTEVYNILTANSDCLTEFKKESINEKKDRHIIKIMYNAVVYEFPINLNTTIGEVKELLLDVLIEKEIITTKNQSARFLFSGKVFKDDNIELKTISNPPYEMTLSVMLKINEPTEDKSPKKGGRKTKKRTSIRMKKTKKNVRR